MISLRLLKGKWSIRQIQGFHSTSDSITYPLPLLRKLSNGMNLHSYLFYQWGESMRRIVKGSQALRFWRLMPKGEKVLSPKQKDRTTILKISKTKGKKYFDWYLS
jgi:hypothetical protein